jgi:hypothetical protein
VWARGGSLYRPSSMVSGCARPRARFLCAPSAISDLAPSRVPMAAHESSTPGRPGMDMEAAALPPLPPLPPGADDAALLFARPGAAAKEEEESSRPSSLVRPAFCIAACLHLCTSAPLQPHFCNNPGTHAATDQSRLRPPPARLSLCYPARRRRPRSASTLPSREDPQRPLKAPCDSGSGGSPEPQRALCYAARPSTRSSRRRAANRRAVR